MRNAYKILVGEPEEKIQLERTRHRWKDTVELDVKEIGCKGCWVLVNTVMNLRVI
jgi:hypothetical protein